MLRRSQPHTGAQSEAGMVQARRVGRCGSRFRAAGEEPDDSSPLPDDREGEGKSFTKLGWYREVLTFAPMSGRGSVFLRWL